MSLARLVGERRLRLAVFVGFVVAVAGVTACQKRSTTTSTSAASAREFESQWYALVGGAQFARAESLIDARERQFPGDAEVYIARGNLYMQQARVRRPGAAPGSGRDSTARPAGFDPALAERAIEALRQGIQRNPSRLDMRFGLTYVLQQLGRPEQEVAVLREAVRYAREHPDDLVWSYGEPLPAPPEVYIPVTLHDYSKFYGDRGGPGDDRWSFEIASLTAEAYPNNPIALNDVAYAHSLRGEWAKGLDYLRRAERADSTNSLVLLNTGVTYHALGQKSAAERYYRRALATAEASGANDVASEARSRLQLLGSGRDVRTAMRPAPYIPPPSAPRARPAVPVTGSQPDTTGVLKQPAPAPPVDSIKVPPVPSEQTPDSPGEIGTP